MFLVANILMVLFMPCMYCFLWKAIQPGEMFGIWQRVIDKVYSFSPNISDFLGGCQICFSHFCAWIAFAIMVSICWQSWPMNVWQSIAYGWGVVTFMWWTGLMFNQWLQLIMHKQYLKGKEVEDYKEQNGE